MLASVPVPVLRQLALFGARDPWIRRWSVPSATVDRRRYTVAEHEAGGFGCSCPAWIYRRRRCRHIQGLEAWLESDRAGEREVRDAEEERPAVGVGGGGLSGSRDRAGGSDAADGGNLSALAAAPGEPCPAGSAAAPAG